MQEMFDSHQLSFISLSIFISGDITAVIFNYKLHYICKTENVISQLNRVINLSYDAFCNQKGKKQQIYFKFKMINFECGNLWVFLLNHLLEKSFKTSKHYSYRHHVE